MVMLDSCELNCGKLKNQVRVKWLWLLLPFGGEESEK